MEPVVVRAPCSKYHNSHAVTAKARNKWSCKSRFTCAFMQRKRVTIMNSRPTNLPTFFLCCQPRSNHWYILVLGSKCYLSSISEQSQIQRADGVKTFQSTVSSDTTEITYNAQHTGDRPTCALTYLTVNLKIISCWLSVWNNAFYR